ncbi:TetR/AcrR family transcriptional regulator [Rhodohalobacter sp. 614A]|uniref:TetR/AcrR family transcriptional regulator n=1 Tax=Rhodohalobacter sp. 614A TaxID=2908649 RepID=UPI001F3DF625|nr:TetR/AcrR family transcriptional regulator [Rhodohalobacter sp. 614A]
MSLRNQILEVSRDLLIQHGFGKLTMRNIAKRADVTATSIYLHFENKDDLLLSLIDQSIEHLKGQLIREIDSSKGLIPQLEDLARAYVRFALEHPQEYEIIYMVRPEEMPQYPKEKFQQIRSAYELLGQIIEQGKQEELIEVENSMISAYTLWAQLHGIVSVILSKRLDTRIPQKEFIDQAIEHIIQGFIIQKTPA